MSPTFRLRAVVVAGTLHLPLTGGLGPAAASPEAPPPQSSADSPWWPLGNCPGAISTAEKVYAAIQAKAENDIHAEDLERRFESWLKSQDAGSGDQGEHPCSRIVKTIDRQLSYLEAANDAGLRHWPIVPVFAQAFDEQRAVKQAPPPASPVQDTEPPTAEPSPTSSRAASKELTPFQLVVFWVGALISLPIAYSVSPWFITGWDKRWAAPVDVFLKRAGIAIAAAFVGGCTLSAVVSGIVK